jgi:hypothetical protein
MNEQRNDEDNKEKNDKEKNFFSHSSDASRGTFHRVSTRRENTLESFENRKKEKKKEKKENYLNYVRECQSILINQTISAGVLSPLSLLSLSLSSRFVRNELLSSGNAAAF